jgi:hypothetical protein
MLRILCSSTFVLLFTALLQQVSSTVSTKTKAIPTPLDDLNYIPDPKEFWSEYITGWKPVMLRGAANDMPAMQWAGDEQESTESKLRRRFGDLKVRIERKYEERQKHYDPKELNPFHSVTINNFFDRVNEGDDGYVISVLPDVMTKDVHVPRCILCGDRKYSHWKSPRRWMTAIEETGLWISTEGATYSQLHFDQPNIINCMISGPSKTWMFVNTKKYHKDVYLERRFRSKYPMNSRNWQPSTSNHSPHRLTEKILQHIPRDIVIQHPGDCIFVPHAYLHQVQKEDHTAKDKVSVAFSIMWNDGEVYNDVACRSTAPVHRTSPPIPLSLFDQHWWYSGYGLVPLGYPLPYTMKEDFIGLALLHAHKLTLHNILTEYKNEYTENLQLVPGHEIYEVLVNFFGLADCNDNGWLSVREIQDIPRSELQHLSAAVDFASTWPDPYQTQPRSLIVKNARALEQYDGISYVEPASETHWMCSTHMHHYQTYYRHYMAPSIYINIYGLVNPMIATSSFPVGHMKDVFSLPNKHSIDVIQMNEKDINDVLTLDEIRATYFPPMNIKEVWNEEACNLAQIKYCGHDCNDQCIIQCSHQYLTKLRKECVVPKPIGKPVILRGMAKSMPAYYKWSSDDIMKQDYSNSVLDVEVGNKQETRTHKQEKMYLNDFVNVYRNRSMYAVAALPMDMANDVILPEWIEQGGYSSHLQAAIMWFSSGGTKSVIHNDDNHNINCLFDGQKRFAFWSIENRKIIESSECGWLDTGGDLSGELGYGSYAGLMNVTAMDLINYPCWSKLKWYDAMMEAGDCILIPSKWYHHVHSLSGRNVAINLWFGSDKNDRSSPSGPPQQEQKQKQKRPRRSQQKGNELEDFEVETRTGSLAESSSSASLRPLTPADCMWDEWPDEQVGEGLPVPCDRSGQYRTSRVASYRKSTARRVPLNRGGERWLQEPTLAMNEIEENNIISYFKNHSNYFHEPKETEFFDESLPSDTTDDTKIPPTFDGLDPSTSKKVRDRLSRGIPVVIRGATHGMKMHGWTCNTMIDMTRKHRKHASSEQISTMNEIPQRHYTKGMSGSEINPYEHPDWMLRSRVVPDRYNARSASATAIGPSSTPGYWSLKSESNNELTNEIRSYISLPQFMKDWEDDHNDGGDHRGDSVHQHQTLHGDFMSSPELWFGMHNAGAKPHQDSHCTSTISFQLNGKKRWRIGPALEIKNVANIYGSYDGYINSTAWKPAYEVVLDSGDAIIIPSSFIHETKNIDHRRDSCSMSITHQFSNTVPVRYIREYLPRLMLSPSVINCGHKQQHDDDPYRGGEPENRHNGITFYYNIGSLGWEKFNVHAIKVYEIQSKSLELWKSFLLYDYDDSNNIELDEFISWIQKESYYRTLTRSALRNVFQYFDVDENDLLNAIEVQSQFERWYTIATFSSMNLQKMNKLRIKREAYKCSICSSKDSESDLCYGPIRSFENRARARFSHSVLRGYPSLDAILSLTMNDVTNSGMSMPCQNLMRDYTHLLHFGHLPGSGDWINGVHPSFIKSYALAKFIDVDQENGGSSKYDSGSDDDEHGEEEEEEDDVEDDEEDVDDDEEDNNGRYEEEHRRQDDQQAEDHEVSAIFQALDSDTVMIDEDDDDDEHLIYLDKKE